MDIMLLHISNPPQNDSPKIMNPLDLEEFKRQGYMMIDFLTDYYKNIENYPVLSTVEPDYLTKRLSSSAPFQPESIESILEDVQQQIIPGITHWMNPTFYAYFPCNGSTAGFIGEMLSTGFNVVGFNWLSSPAATELETIVMDWLGKMLNLPKSFIFSSCDKGGGGCEAILCTH
jgi:tyrosine decarboxylase